MNHLKHDPEHGRCRGGDCALRAEGREPHPCPYDEEMAGGEVDTRCNCCVACTHECARDT